MANRHLSRSVVMQTLFEWDFRSLSPDEAEKALVRNGEEFAPGNAGDLAFMKNLLMGVLERRPDLDLIIEKAAPEWPIDRISPVDRAVLRVGLYELLFADREDLRRRKQRKIRERRLGRGLQRARRAG